MPFKVLVVEDEPDLQEVLRDVLEDAGYSVSVACNGLEALRHLDEDLSHLILLDLMLPVMDGMEFTRHLQQRGLRSLVPVLIVSAYPDPTIAERLGAVGFVQKPYEVDDLLNQVRQFAF